jgi:uncharacterized protein YjiK
MTAGRWTFVPLLALLVSTRLAGQAQRAPDQGALSHYDLDASAAWQAELPRALSEVSGLAFTRDGSLLAHGDERAVIWRYDLTTRRPVARFGLAERRGRRVMHGDFEDLAIVDERLFLVTGTGEIFEGRIGTDGQLGRAVRRTPALGAVCEAEGLTWDAATRSLLVLCKSVRSRRWKHGMVILAVSIDTWRYERQPRILVADEDLERATSKKHFQGSAMTRHPRTGTLIVIAGPEHSYVELSPTGKVLGGGQLDGDRHRQPEGVAVAPDLTLLISDEASGGKATITAYAYHP